MTAAESEQQSLGSGAGKNDGLLGNFVRRATQATNLQTATLAQNKAQPDKGNLLEANADKKDEQSSKSVLKQEREKLQAHVDSLKERVSQRMEERARISSNREKQMSRKTTAVARVAESRAGLEKHRFCSNANIQILSSALLANYPVMSFFFV